jgi:DNA (cytosine-5)-methyltransferase 1
MKLAAVDLFCDEGGLTRGLLDAHVNVVAGYDISEECRYPYEHNNSPARFHCQGVTALNGDQLAKHYRNTDVRVLVGCAPCVTFSEYTQGSFFALESGYV